MKPYARGKKKRIVVVGGGTGTFTVLSGLKKYPAELTAVVAMSDDGGSTGMLRDELGVLPPGDIRQCLVALSRSDRLMRKLMTYRFQSGTLKGHNFGNLLLSALEKITGSFDAAVEKASDILRIQGKVIPATLDKVKLIAYLTTGKVLRGQYSIEQHDLARLKKIVLEPNAKANPKAIRAIKEAEVIVIGPGDLYSSVLPNLLIAGIPAAIRRSRAKKVCVCNLMTKAGQTDGFTVRDYAHTIEHYLKSSVDCVIYNNKKPTAALLRRYAREGEQLVKPNKTLSKTRYFGADLISRKFPRRHTNDPIQRNLIRHNPRRLADIIIHKIAKL